MQKASEKWGRLVERGIMRAYEIEVGGKSVECREEREKKRTNTGEKRERNGEVNNDEHPAVELSLSYFNGRLSNA